VSTFGRRSIPRSEPGPGDSGPEAISGLLEGVLEDLGAVGKVRECQALLAWESVAGPQLAQHARAVRVHRGRLQLAVPSAVWRTHLSFSKQLLVERINQRLGRRVIRDLVFVNRRIQDRAGG
jgi:predicted nucleic acid-binding Zn ribbon protein